MVYGTPGLPHLRTGGPFRRGGRGGYRRGVTSVLRAADIPTDAWEPRRRRCGSALPQPTGSITGAGELAGLIGACRQHDALLLADECYCDLYEDEPPPSALQLAGSGSPGVSYLSCSKRSG